MTENEWNKRPEEQIAGLGRSIEVLERLNDSDRFGVEGSDKSQVAAYMVDSRGHQVSAFRFSADDFLMAVDYYRKNRIFGSESVEVGPNEDRYVAVQMRAGIIAPMLELEGEILRKRENLD